MWEGETHSCLLSRREKTLGFSCFNGLENIGTLEPREMKIGAQKSSEVSTKEIQAEDFFLEDF